MKKFAGALVLVLTMAAVSFGGIASYQLTVNGALPSDTPAAHVDALIGLPSDAANNVTVSVWMKTDFGITGTKVFVGWDTANVRGATTPLDGKLSGELATNQLSALNTLPSNSIVGGRATSGVRPYGTWFGGNLTTGVTQVFDTWTKVGDVTITNIGLAAGESYTVALWDNSGTNSTNETTVAPIAGNEIQILNDVVLTAVPEPATIGLMLLGLGLLRRKH